MLVATLTGESDLCTVLFVAVLYFDYIPWWGALLISIGMGFFSMLLVQFVLVPYERKRVVGEFTVLCAHANINSLFQCVVEFCCSLSNEVTRAGLVATMWHRVKLNAKTPVTRFSYPVNVSGHFC